MPGSRAVVYECQFGPRRKNHVKKTAKASLDASSAPCGYRHSCPARYDAGHHCWCVDYCCQQWWVLFVEISQLLWQVNCWSVFFSGLIGLFTMCTTFRLGPQQSSQSKHSGLLVWVFIGQKWWPVFGKCASWFAYDCWLWGITSVCVDNNGQDFFIFMICLQCFDTVGWAAGRASGL